MRKIEDLKREKRRLLTVRRKIRKRMRIFEEGKDKWKRRKEMWVREKRR